MERKDILISLLALSLILSFLGTYDYYESSQKKVESLERNINILKQELREKKSQITQLKVNLSNKTQELNVSLSRIENLTLEVETLEADLEDLKEKNEELERKARLAKPVEKDYHILAVSNGEGDVLGLETEVQLGDGEVSVTVNKVLFQNTTQISVNRAWKVSEEYTEMDLSQFDGEVRIDHGYEGYLSVTGDSGGSAFAITFIAALKNKTINKDILITGSLGSDGGIERVGEAEEKVKAAREFGAEKVLVPAGSNVEVSGIVVEEVSDITEAAEIIL